MKHNYYLPDSDKDKALWLIAFAAALPTYATALGLTPAQVASVVADSFYFSEVVGLVIPFKDFSQTLTTYKNELRDGSTSPIGGFPVPPVAPSTTPVLAGIFVRVPELVQTIKNNPAYNETMGQNLGIIGSEVTVDFDTIQPVIKVEHKNGHAYVKWHHNHTDAADIYVDLGNGAGYVFAGRISTVHYLEPQMPAAGQSAVYKFKLRYVVNDQQVGVESFPVSITVTG